MSEPHDAEAGRASSRPSDGGPLRNSKLAGVIAAEAPERACAELVGLRYVRDDGRGIRRNRRGGGFVYVSHDGARVRDDETLARIRALAIPPAYEHVWISPDPRGHLQATGRDARGRKQYRYHPRWREVRDAVKYHRMIAFGDALPRVRARLDRDLDRAGVGREKILATIVRLLDRTHIRVGNDEYARDNRSFGLTTLTNRHARVDGATIRFEFRGKSGKLHSVGVTDRRLARVVRRCLEIPGCELFQWVDAGGARRAIDSGEVNEYLREIAGDDFTAKDFRTWAGTVRACRILAEAPACSTERAAKKVIVEMLVAVSRLLGNTPAVCKRAYVHPAVLDAFSRGWMAEVAATVEPAKSARALHADERFALALLRRAEARPSTSLGERLEKSIAGRGRKAA